MEVTAEEIDEYFMKVEERLAKEREATALAKAQGEEIKQRHSSLLRYKEPLQLNLKGYTSAFKSVTRAKRDSLLLGNPGGGTKEKTPAIGHYYPRWESIQP